MYQNPQISHIIFVRTPFCCFSPGSYQRLRVPFIMYSAHVATTLVAIMAHILFYDFSNAKYPGPETREERLKLLAIYSPYLLIPLLLLVRAAFFWGEEATTLAAPARRTQRKKNQ